MNYQQREVPLDYKRLLSAIPGDRDLDQSRPARSIAARRCGG